MEGTPADDDGAWDRVLRSGGERVPDRTALEVEQAFEAVFALGRRSEANEVSGCAGLEQRFEGHRGHVVALVDDDQPVLGEQLRGFSTRARLGSMAISSRLVRLPVFPRRRPISFFLRPRKRMSSWRH
jgi:hypothetical protein